MSGHMRERRASLLHRQHALHDNALVVHSPAFRKDAADSKSAAVCQSPGPADLTTCLTSHHCQSVGARQSAGNCILWVLRDISRAQGFGVGELQRAQKAQAPSEFPLRASECQTTSPLCMSRGRGVHVVSLRHYVSSCMLCHRFSSLAVLDQPFLRRTLNKSACL